MNEVNEKFTKMVKELMTFATENRIPILISNGPDKDGEIQSEYNFSGNMIDLVALVTQATLSGASMIAKHDNQVFANIVREVSHQITHHAVSMIADSQFDNLPVKGGIN